MFLWNFLAFSMIQQMLAIWSLVPLPFLKPAWTSGSSRYFQGLPWFQSQSLHVKASFAYFATKKKKTTTTTHLHLNCFWRFLTGGKLAQALLGPCISDPWPSTSLNRWKHNCINTDKWVFLNCPLWGNAVLNAWFTDLFNTCLLSVDYVWDTFAGIEATRVNEIDKSSFMELIS